MKGPSYRRRPEGRYRATHRNLRQGFLPRSLGLRQDQVAALVFDSGTIQATELKPGDIPAFRGERSRRASRENWARQSDRIDAVPARTNESVSRPNARASIMVNVPGFAARTGPKYRLLFVA
jgi:hypothetical protein